MHNDGRPRGRQGKQKQNQGTKAARNVAALPASAELGDTEDIEDVDRLLVRSVGACGTNTRL